MPATKHYCGDAVQVGSGDYEFETSIDTGTTYVASTSNGTATLVRRWGFDMGAVQLNSTSVPISIDVTAISGTASFYFDIARYNSTGILQTAGSASPTYTTTGIKTATLTLSTTFAAGDRFTLRMYVWRNTGTMGTVTVTINVEDLDTYAEPDYGASASRRVFIT